MKTVVIYHRSDFDGIFCREIARKFLPEAELIGWEYGDPTLPFPEKDTLYVVLDLSMVSPFGLKFEDGWLARDNPIMEKEHRQIQPIDRMDFSHWLWVDHHKSNIESHPKEIPGYRIDGVAACRLAWHLFAGEPPNFANRGGDQRTLSSKQNFIDRQVSEPLAVRLAGEYDIWDKRDPDAELFQHGLISEAIVFPTLLEWPEEHSGRYTVRLLNQGRAIQYAKTQENKSIIQHQSFRMKWEGVNFLCCNHARFNSFLFTAGLMDDDQACLGFCWDGGKWKVSLYHTPGHEHHDLSVIASKYGGGGHRGACGFTCKELPFPL